MTGPGLKWDLAAVADAVGGRATGNAVVTAVTTDSRSVPSGALFVALRGERFDGHDFSARALDAGAAAVMVEQGRAPGDAASVEVADTLGALRSLAVKRRGELDSIVVAVTGSTGKTSTKDLVGAALGSGAHASPHSFNNEIGVPLTVLYCPDSAAALVVEVGSRGRGDIALLAPAIRPDVAVVTAAGRAHLETFGDDAGVLAAKWELVEALGPAGIAVLPFDDPRMTRRRPQGVVTFGETPAADVAAMDVSLDDAGRPSFTLRHEGVDVAVAMKTSGRHQARNAAAATAAAIAAGVRFEVAAGRVATAEGSPMRMEVSRVAIGDGMVTVVNDAYNANPDSMQSAFDTVAVMEGRKIAVLGKMHELGLAEAEAHREVGRAASSAGFAAILVVGDDPGIAVGSGDLAHPVRDVDAAVATLGEMLEPGDVVLVKASRAEGLERVAGRIGGAQ